MIALLSEIYCRALLAPSPLVLGRSRPYDYYHTPSPTYSTQPPFPAFEYQPSATRGAPRGSVTVPEWLLCHIEANHQLHDCGITSTLRATWRIHILSDPIRSYLVVSYHCRVLESTSPCAAMVFCRFGVRKMAYSRVHVHAIMREPEPGCGEAHTCSSRALAFMSEALIQCVNTVPSMTTCQFILEIHNMISQT